MAHQPDEPQAERDVVTMREIRDKLIALSVDHEAAGHNGEPCTSFRYNAVAYLAHCLGLSTAHAIPILRALSLYDRGHQQPVQIHSHPEI